MHTTLPRALLLVTAATLALSACRDSGTADVDALEAISVKGLSDADIAKHFEVEPCTATEAEMQAGLAALGLDTPSDTANWDSREMEDGGFEFEAMTLTGDKGETLDIAELDLTCLREVDGEVMVDRVSAEGVALSSEGYNIRMASLTVVEPNGTGELRAFFEGRGNISIPDARAFAMDDFKAEFTMTDAQAGDGTAIDVDTGELQSDLSNVQTGNGELEIASFAFAEAANGAADGFFRMGELEFEGTDDGQSFDIDFEGATVTGMSSFEAFAGGGLGAAGSRIVGGPNLGYETLDIGAFNVAADTLRLTGGGIVGENTARGGTIAMRSEIEPITLRFEGEPLEADLRPIYDALAGMGYKEVTVSARSEGSYDEATDRIASEGGYFVMEDGFRLEIDSKATGLKAMQAAQQEAGGDPFASLGAMKIESLTVRLEDNSIVDRVFAALAADQGTTPKMLRMQAKGLLAMGTLGASGSGIDPEIISESVSALGEFIDSPNSTLVLTLDPGGPLGMDNFTGATKDDLGFVARVEK